MKENIKVVVGCVLFVAFIVLLTALKVDAYGGDPDCLIIQCVKVK